MSAPQCDSRPLGLESQNPQITLTILNHTIPLNRGRVETVLENAQLHMRSGIHSHRIIEHFTHHATDADPQCPCCKLEGRILSAQGRKSNLQYTPSRKNRAGGTVQIRHLRPGLSGAQIRELDRRASLRSSKPAQPEPIKSTTQRVEDLI